MDEEEGAERGGCKRKIRREEGGKRQGWRKKGEEKVDLYIYIYIYILF